MKCNHKWLYLIFGNRLCKRCPMSLTLFMPVPDKDGVKQETKPETKCIAQWMPILLTETTAAINSLVKIALEKK